MNLSSWLPPLLCAAGSAVALVIMVRNLQRARLIEDTPTSRIRSAAQGYVELQGFARLGDEPPLLAPLTNTPCLWYRYRIEREDNSSKHHQWRAVESGTSTRPFWLDDDSGRCSVEPKQAEVTPTRRQQWNGERRHPLKVTPDGLPGLLNDVLNGSGEYRYTEERLHDGDWLYLTGWFESSHPPSADVQAVERSKLLLREWKQDQTELLTRFDRNRDGEIDLAEWENVRSAASREAQQQVLRDFDHSQRHTLRAPSTGQPFLISSQDPEQLAGRYRRRALFALIAATLLAITVGVLIARH